jgi:6-phosphogluconolactonase
MLLYNTYETMSIAAAHFFVTEYEKAIIKKERFTVALSGGNTPEYLYTLLTTHVYSRNINWKKVFIFFSDERFVPHTSKESNYKMACGTLLSNIPIPAKNIFGKDALRYERSVKKIFGTTVVPAFDLVLLGMGADGHTASLFPGSVLLKEKKRLVKEVYLVEKDIYRISFTLPLINRSKQILILVSGKEKTPILKKIFSRRITKDLLPVQMVKGNVMWMITSPQPSP